MNTTPRPPRFDRQWTESIKHFLDIDDREALTSAIRQYQLDGTEPRLTGALAVAFEFLRPTIDRRARDRARRRAKAESAISSAAKSVSDFCERHAGATADVSVPASVPLAVAQPQVSESSVPAVDDDDAISAPGEDEWKSRYDFWKNFSETRSTPLTGREIAANRLSFETDLWEGEEEDEVPDHPDGTPMPYTEILQHYCLILRNDRRLLTRIADEVARFTKVLYRTSDLINHIDAFIYQSTAYPIINLNRANCRRAFIRYMINCARHYRTTL